MSKCELCGGDVLRFSDGYKGCLNPTCAMGSATYVEQSFDRIQTALALLRRVEEGESVEIRKRDGEWPEMLICKGGFTVIEINGKRQRFGMPLAAANAWNGGGK